MGKNFEDEPDFRWHESGWLEEDLAGDRADLYTGDSIRDMWSPAERALCDAMDLAAGITMVVEERSRKPIECLADIIKAKQKLAEQEGELTSDEIAAALVFLVDAEEYVLKEMGQQAKIRGMTQGYRAHAITANIQKAMRYRGIGVGLAASRQRLPRKKA